MHLARIIAPLDLRAVLTHLCRVTRLLALVLTLPLAVALLFREWTQAATFALLAAMAFLIGRIRLLPWSPDLEAREGLVVTALTYLLFALAGSVPFLAVAPFADSFFESMSGFTTTGLSTLDVEILPQSLLFFRAYSQWLGGAGIIVLSLVVLMGPGQAAFTLYGSEFGEENLVGSVIATARVVLKAYATLTALGFVAFLAVGMAPFDSMLHVMATLSTGGFSTHTASIGHYQGANGVLLAVTLFMFLGAVSFPLYYHLRRDPGRFRRDEQLRGLLTIGFVAALTAFAVTGFKPHRLLPWLFEMVSSLTTTGFCLTPPAQWPADIRLLSVILMVIGGTAGSTAGGIKLFRLIITARVALRQLIALLLPRETVLATKLNDEPVSDNEIRQIFAFLFLYLAILVFSTLLFTMGGYSLADALFESSSALGTVGLSSGITSPELATGFKLLLIFDMWAGRLEILPILITFYPGRLWRQRSTPCASSS
ncbi:MAG: TrkH family potassium uptake protein [Desulfobulbaceae bacterium]|nr:TrkH family potassium uptake protein [Desulfobulbaceae bacterium]